MEALEVVRVGVVAEVANVMIVAAVKTLIVVLVELLDVLWHWLVDLDAGRRSLHSGCNLRNL